ncbi:MAG: AEC family transporter, partial [Oscillospiraceae bacterium]|nr:AEC family transporter [Oscillospiraceae bacterium]
MESFASATNVFLLIVMALPGYGLKKAGKIPEQFAGGLTSVLLYVSLPCLTVSSFVKKTYEPRLLGNMGAVAVLSVVLLLLAYAVSTICFAFTQENGAKKSCVAAGYMNNCAFMGIPVLQAMFPGESEPIIYAAIFSLPFTIFTWTLLVYSLTGDRRYMSVRNALLNPQTLALAAALPIFFSGLSVPAPIVTTLDYLGGMTTPLSMVLLGVKLAEAPVKSLFNTPLVYVSAAVKLILVPLVSLGTLLLARLFVPLSAMAAASLFLIMAIPTAANVVMFAEQ